jgi:uncharacterized protein (TIGR00255 family)
LSLLGAVPQLVMIHDPRQDQAELEPALGALAAALDDLDAMRGREGRELARDLGARLGEARAARETIGARAGDQAERARTRLRERLARLLADTAIELDEGRLEVEVALIADRSDISEELARLDSHLAELERLLGADGPLGRRIDFLLQEVAREANTIGAKSLDAETTQSVVALKTAVERMRQQAQNVE